MFRVHCTDCSHELRDVNETPCPQCGSNKRTVQLEARGQAVTMASARISRRNFEREVKKNWPLIATVGACNLLSAIPAYFLSGIPSVVFTLAFVTITTVLGYFMITRVITITLLD